MSRLKKLNAWSAANTFDVRFEMRKDLEYIKEEIETLRKKLEHYEITEDDLESPIIRQTEFLEDTCLDFFNKFNNEYRDKLSDDFKNR